MFKDSLVSSIKRIPVINFFANFLYMTLSIVRNKALKPLIFSPPGHFYSPIPSMQDIETLDINEDKTHINGIDINTNSQIQLLEKFKCYYSDLLYGKTPSTHTLRYNYSNPYFGEGDAIILYCMLRHFEPKRVIEIGSGYSSALMLDTNEYFFSGSIDLTFIDPYPKRLLKLLSKEDISNNHIIQQNVQKTNLDNYLSLVENDILFVDSSHVIKAGSDVCHIIFNILPKLHKGVLIHFHDILWPFEYPKNWLKQGIAWNEAYALRAFLQHNTHYEILYFNDFISSQHKHLLQTNLPECCKNPGGSLWLRKIA